MRTLAERRGASGGLDVGRALSAAQARDRDVGRVLISAVCGGPSAR